LPCSFPTGISIRPPFASWSMSGWGMVSAAAPTCIASYLWSISYPLRPSPSTKSTRPLSRRSA
uniref:Cytochrome oxidase subunit 1 n=1 Tax=Haemonchus placei TaxID=6290 RepID=A0A0N4WSV5_HAEPC